MRKHLWIAVLAIVALSLIVSAPAFAKGIELTGKIESVTVKLDKNGKQYVRFIVPVEGVTQQGTKYEESLPVMAFGDHVARAKTMKAGQILKVVVQPREYQGRQSYTILKYMP
jgi:hypothetical protein